MINVSERMRIQVRAASRDLLVVVAVVSVVVVVAYARCVLLEFLFATNPNAREPRRLRYMRLAFRIADRLVCVYECLLRATFTAHKTILLRFGVYGE